MEVSNCPECKKALRAALVQNLDLSKLKMKDGHLPGCPTQKEVPNVAQQTYPWSEAQYKIVPSPRPEPAESGAHGGGMPGDSPQGYVPTGGQNWGAPGPGVRPAGPPPRSDRPAKPRGRARVHGNGYAEAVADKQPIQRVRVVDSTTPGELKDRRKGIWFVVLVLSGVIIVPLFPPIGLAFIGAIAMLFLL